MNTVDVLLASYFNEAPSYEQYAERQPFTYTLFGMRQIRRSHLLPPAVHITMLVFEGTNMFLLAEL